MPAILPAGAVVGFGPTVLLQRPALAARIGAVAAAWAHVEEGLMHLYGFLMGLENAKPDDYVPIHPVAMQVFDSMESIRVRTKLLRKLGAWRIKEETERRELHDMLEQVERKASQRNKVVHSNWGICEDYLDALIRVPVFGPQEIWREPDFDDITSVLGHLSHKIVQFRFDLEPPNAWEPAELEED